jgi:predicted small lipoprotein YifL
MKNSFLIFTSTVALLSLAACGKAPEQSTPEQATPEQAAETSQGTAVLQEAVSGAISDDMLSDTVSTFARFVPERKDDFAWENDLVAFRAYGPALRDGGENAGVDCWLKKVEYPIINKWYKLHLEQDISYHQDHGEGLDNYHVGSSAGCGGTAMWIDGERQALEAYTSWDILSSTPDKTVFQLTYENEINGSLYAETKKITIELGNRLYLAESTFTKDGEVAANTPIAIGVTTHDGKATPVYSKEDGWLMAWENLGGYGLGTAVMVGAGNVQSVEILDKPEVKDYSHALLIVNTDENGTLSYASGYGWEGAGVITTPEQWQAYLAGSSVLR